MAYCIMFTLFGISLHCTCSPTHAVTILGLKHWCTHSLYLTNTQFALSNLHVCLIQIRPCPLILPVPPVLLYARTHVCAPITCDNNDYNCCVQSSNDRQLHEEQMHKKTDFEELLPTFGIRPATWLHEIAVPISPSPQLIRPGISPAQWVTLHNN